MKTAPSDLLVWVEDKNAWIKITGRASFNSSVDFKTLINGLSQRGFCRFVLDLSDCPLMDSTFLGVLAGMITRFTLYAGMFGGGFGGGRGSRDNDNGAVAVLARRPNIRNRKGGIRKRIEKAAVLGVKCFEVSDSTVDSPGS